MTAGVLSGVPDRLWARLKASEHRLLMLDYDGTLSPFHPRREEARPLAGAVRLIGAIASDAHSLVAVVSGRTLADLRRFLGALPVRLVGEHGWEEARPRGGARRHALPRPSSAALRRAAAAARAAGFAERLERKRCSVVLHTRGLSASGAEAAERACERVWRVEAEGAGLALDRIDGGLELRARGRDKGIVVRELIASSPSPTLAVYLGDDASDEDALREVRSSGYGIRVGPASRPSLAAGRLPDEEAVTAFLARWLDIVRPSTG